MGMRNNTVIKLSIAFLSFAVAVLGFSVVRAVSRTGFEEDKGAQCRTLNGNVKNDGMAVYDAGTVCFNDPGDNHWFGKIGPGDRISGRFPEHSPFYLTVAGDYIYRVNDYARLSMTRVKRDGSGLARLNGELAVRPCVSDEPIYCTSYSQLKFTLYQLSLDGSQERKINDCTCWMHQVEGDWA